MTGLSPMVYTLWDLLDSDIFNLLTCACHLEEVLLLSGLS